MLLIVFIKLITLYRGAQDWERLVSEIFWFFYKRKPDPSSNTSKWFSNRSSFSSFLSALRLLPRLHLLDWSPRLWPRDHSWRTSMETSPFTSFLMITPTMSSSGMSSGVLAKAVPSSTTIDSTWAVPPKLLVELFDLIRVSTIVLVVLLAWECALVPASSGINVGTGAMFLPSRILESLEILNLL